MAASKHLPYQISILLALLFFSARGSASESVWYGRCVGVSDGDTIKVLTTAKQQIRVRIAFIDAPEKGQPFGQCAKEAMSDLVFGKDVELRPHGIDRYGRLVARVFVAGQDAGLELLKQGLCWVYEKYFDQAPPKSRAVIAAPKIWHKLKEPVSGKTLTQWHRGSGETGEKERTKMMEDAQGVERTLAIFRVEANSQDVLTRRDVANHSASGSGCDIAWRALQAEGCCTIPIFG